MQGLKQRQVPRYHMVEATAHFYLVLVFRYATQRYHSTANRSLWHIVYAQVTGDGDVLYIFPGFACGDKERNGRGDRARMVEELDNDERGEGAESRVTATPEVLQFEVPHDTAPYCCQ